MPPLKPEIVQPDPMQEIMAKLFGNLDLNLPELKPNAWFIERKLYKWKMADLAAISTDKATIAANNAVAMKANIELMGMLMNIPLMVEDYRNSIEDKRQMAAIMRARELLVNQTMQIEAKDRATELEMKMKELGIGSPNV